MESTFGSLGSFEEQENQGRRSTLEMVCDILGVLATGPTKPTHILHKANMSWRVLSSHLDRLNVLGFIEREKCGGNRVEYTLTQKGRSILQLYEGLRLSLSGDANVYPTRSSFPLIERAPRQGQRTQVWGW